MSAHALYVAAAYGVAALTLAGLGFWLVLDHRERRRELLELEAGGIRRRSERKSESTP